MVTHLKGFFLGSRSITEIADVCVSVEALAAAGHHIYLRSCLHGAVCLAVSQLWPDAHAGLGTAYPTLLKCLAIVSGPPAGASGLLMVTLQDFISSAVAEPAPVVKQQVSFLSFGRDDTDTISESLSPSGPLPTRALREWSRRRLGTSRRPI